MLEAAQTLSDDMVAQGLTVIFDDRRGVSPGVKFKDAELIGMPTIVVVGKGLADGMVEVRDRRTGEREDVAVAEAAAHLVAVRSLVTAVEAVVFDWGGTLTPWHTIDLREQWRRYAEVYDPDARRRAVRADPLRRGRRLAGRPRAPSLGDARRDLPQRRRRASTGERHERALAAYHAFWEPHTFTDPDVPDLIDGLTGPRHQGRRPLEHPVDP